MQERIDRVLNGFDVVASLRNGEHIYPCFICSPTSPKFGKGWEVRLHDSQEIVLIGADCGKRYLDKNYAITVRAFEAAERERLLLEAQAAFLNNESYVARAAIATINDPALQAIMDIKAAVSELSSSARKALEAAANGAMAGVQALPALAHGGPRGNAREVLRLLEQLKSARDAAEVEPIIKALRREIDEHNALVIRYGDGRAGMSAGNIRGLNAKMPQINLRREGSLLIVERQSDGLRRELSIPARLDLRPIPYPK